MNPQQSPIPTPETGEPDGLAGAIGGFIDGQKARIADLERERDKALSLFESSKSARKSLSDACDHLQRELDNAIADAKQFEVDCIRALHERNEAREQRDRLAEALEKCRDNSIAIQRIRYGWDGDCGATQLAESIEEDCDLALAAVKGGQQ